MHYCRHIPCAPLSEVVDWFWFFSGLDVPHRRERVLPDGSMELIINLDESPRKLFDRACPERFVTFHRAWIAGARSDHILIDVQPQSSMMGVHFKAGGLTPFLGLPATELTGQVVELDTVWGDEANELRERLLQVKTPAAKFRVLERFLVRRLTGPPELPPAVRAAMERLRDGATGGQLRRLAADLGYSHKHFIDLFRDNVGLTPKRFARVCRFQRALAAVHAGIDVDWADVACEAGYYDQAHFANDFREFSGFSPSDYLRRRNGERNFVPLDD